MEVERPRAEYRPRIDLTTDPAARTLRVSDNGSGLTEEEIVPFGHFARETGVEAINARWMWWDRSIVNEVHALGMLAFGYDAQRRFSTQPTRP